MLPQQPEPQLHCSGSHVGSETLITMPVSTTPAVSPPGEYSNAFDNGGSSHIITVMAGPPITISNNTFSTALPGPGDSQVRHLCRPKAFRQLSNSTSLIDEIFNHPDASETLLREKIKKANDLDTSRDLFDYLRNKTPPPENYMSYAEKVKGGELPVKNKKKGVVSSLLRKLRRPKKDGKTSSAPAPLFQLPDSAVAGRTIGGHRHIAISIPLEHANIDGIVDGTEPPAEALPEEESPVEPVPEETLPEEPVPAEPVPAEPPQPDTKAGPIIIRRKPLINGTPPVVGARSSSAGAPTGTARIISPPPEKAPSPMLDPDETLVVPPIASPEPPAAQRCGSSKGGAGRLPEVVGGRSLVGCSHRELTAAPRVAVAGVVVPLSGVFSPPRPLHRSPPLRHLYAISNSGSKETVSETATSSTAMYNSAAESTASSSGATVGPSVIPEKKGQQNTAPNTEPIDIPAPKKSYRDWCGTVQLPSPPAEPEDPLSSPSPDRFVTAQTSPSPETDNSSPWATPFEESTFIDYPPCGSSTPKLRPLPSPPPAAPTTPKNNKVSKHRQRRRRIPRSESHVQLMAKYQRLQMLRARELELLLGRVVQGRSEVDARRGHVSVHALEPGHYTTAAAAGGGGGMAVLYERDDGCDGEVSSLSFREGSSSADDGESTILPENLASDYEESSSDGYPPPSPEAGSDTIRRTRTREYDNLPSRRYGFTPARASSTASSPRRPMTVQSDDSFETFLERMDAATRDALAARETRRWSVDHGRHRGGEYDGLGGGGWGGGGDGLETIEPVMRWLIETSCGGEVAGSGE